MMLKNRLGEKMFVALTAFFCLLLTAPALYATTWDVTADFSGTNNPNGDWSYGYETSTGGTFTLYTTNFVAFVSPAWGWGSCPNVWVNTDTVAHHNVQPGELTMHPGPSGEVAVTRWISPLSGTVTIDGKFGAGDGGPMSYYIYKDGASILEIFNTGSDGPFSLSETVSAGTVIDFMVGVGNSGYWAGNTPLHTIITYTPAAPLPGAVWLLGSGLIGLLGLGRKFKI